MFGMNQEQIMGVVRQGLLIFGTLATALGWISPEKVASLTAMILSLVGPVFMVASVIWSGFNKTQANMITLGASQTDPNGIPLVRSVELNPHAEGTTALSQVTPSNVAIGK